MVSTFPGNRITWTLAKPRGQRQGRLEPRSAHVASVKAPLRHELDFAEAAALAGEPARAAMLALLFDGRAIPAGELATAAGISRATASAHLAKLVEGGLLRVHAQGRHRYYELADAQVASALETLASLSRPSRVHSLSQSLRADRLRFARTCYNHLAGELALSIADALVASRALARTEDGFHLDVRAPEVFRALRIDISALLSLPQAHVRGCIDWTERRRHIAGPLGTALLRALIEADVLKRTAERRVIHLASNAHAVLSEILGISLMENEIIAR